MCRARVAAGLAVLPAGRSAGNHFRFGVCDNTLAADFAALLAFGLLSTLLAADAAFGLVCRVFLFGITLTSARVPDRQAVAVRPERTTGPAPHVEEPGWRGSRS